MGSPIEVKAACKCHPSIAADASNERGVLRYAVDGNSQSFALPAMWKGCNVSVRPVGVAIQYGTSKTAAASITTNQASAAGTGSAAAAASLADGEIGDALIGSKEDFMNWRGASAAGFVEFYKSERPVL